LVYERISPRWEIAVACSDMGFQQVSFVNSIATSKGIFCSYLGYEMKSNFSFFTKVLKITKGLK
jgi:hypothetical protein